MSGDYTNNTSQPSSPPPVGAPTAPRAMRKQAARGGVNGISRGSGAMPSAPAPAVPQTPGQNGPSSAMQTPYRLPLQTPLRSGRSGRMVNGDDDRSGAAVVFGVAEGSNTRVRHPSAEAYPPSEIEQRAPRVGGHIRPPPGLFQPPTGPAYQPRSDANQSCRISSDGAAYPSGQQNRRASQGYTREQIERQRPSEGECSLWDPIYIYPAPGATEMQTGFSYPLLITFSQEPVPNEHIVASRRRSQEIFAERAAESRRQMQEQSDLQNLFAAQQRRGREMQPRPETEEERAAREQAERIQAARQQFEQGRSFEDDDDFYPRHRRNGGSI